MADDFQKEPCCPGITNSPACVRTPEGNGCAERFMRTLTENLLWARLFDSVEDLRMALFEFREICTTPWLIERHRFRTTSAVRHRQLSTTALAVSAPTRCLADQGRYRCRVSRMRHSASDTSVAERNPERLCCRLWLRSTRLANPAWS